MRRHCAGEGCCPGPSPRTVYEAVQLGAVLLGLLAAHLLLLPLALLGQLVLGGDDGLVLLPRRPDRLANRQLPSLKQARVSRRRSGRPKRAADTDPQEGRIRDRGARRGGQVARRRGARRLPRGTGRHRPLITWLPVGDRLVPPISRGRLLHRLVLGGGWPG